MYFFPCNEKIEAKKKISPSTRCLSCYGAIRPHCDRVFAAFPDGSGASRLRRDRDAASPRGLGANVCLRRDYDACAVGAVPLRYAPPVVAGLRGRREVEAAVSCLDLDVSDFSACHQLTVIVLCLTSLTVVARCMRV